MSWLLTAAFAGALTMPAAAHPLDVHLQAAYLSLAPDTITLDLDVSPGILVAPAALAELDTDADKKITEQEASAYAVRVLTRVELHADRTPLTVALTGVEVPDHRTIQAGYGTIRIHAEARGAPTGAGEHELFFRNGTAPPGAAFQVNALVSESVVLGAQERDATQQESRIHYRIDPAGADAAAARPADSGTTGTLAGLLESRTLSLTVVLIALGFAALLGALHALAPGHAKTLMAAYLVGSGGTTRHALTLGAVVTVHPHRVGHRHRAGRPVREPLSRTRNARAGLGDRLRVAGAGDRGAPGPAADRSPA